MRRDIGGMRWREETCEGGGVMVCGVMVGGVRR